MFINGVRISNSAYTISGNSVTYLPANNGSNVLRDGDRIEFVQDAVVLENLISKYLFNSASRTEAAPAAAPESKE